MCVFYVCISLSLFSVPVWPILCYILCVCVFCLSLSRISVCSYKLMPFVECGFSKGAGTWCFDGLAIHCVESLLSILSNNLNEFSRDGHRHAAGNYATESRVCRLELKPFSILLLFPLFYFVSTSPLLWAVSKIESQHQHPIVMITQRHCVILSADVGQLFFV